MLTSRLIHSSWWYFKSINIYKSGTITVLNQLLHLLVKIFHFHMPTDFRVSIPKFLFMMQMDINCGNKFQSYTHFIWLIYGTLVYFIFGNTSGSLDWLITNKFICEWSLNTKVIFTFQCIDSMSIYDILHWTMFHDTLITCNDLSICLSNFSLWYI